MTTTTFEDLIDAISNAGGVPILVGGAVRDFVMYGVPKGATHPDIFAAKDVDIEVFGLTLPRLQDALSSKSFSWDEVGEQFSVLKVNVLGLDGPVDLSIPRYETSTGNGHREFEVMVNPELTFKEAARRRDFTMNSLGFEVLTGELLDPYNGKQDIEHGFVVRVSNAFSEDPLRPLRAARFAARFGYTIERDTLHLCKSMRPLADSLPSERIWMEIEKAVHETKKLGKFFDWLYLMNWLDIFPEIYALDRIEQDKEWHPEGGVLVHTCEALDYWSQNLRTGNKEDDLITAIAILCHDFGKVTHTQYNQKPGHITAHGHEEAGAEPTRTFLHRLRQYELAKEVVPLVENHLAPVFGPHTPRALRRLSVKVKRMDLLALVSKADQAGRPPKDPTEAFNKIGEFYQAYANLELPRGGPKPLVGGDYLIRLGLTPGRKFKVILDAVYEKQLDGQVEDEDQAKEFVKAFAEVQGMREYK